MAADGKMLRGEVVENPEAEERNVERLLLGFLDALLKEQAPQPAQAAAAAAKSAESAS